MNGRVHPRGVWSTNSECTHNIREYPNGVWYKMWESELMDHAEEYLDGKITLKAFAEIMIEKHNWDNLQVVKWVNKIRKPS